MSHDERHARAADTVLCLANGRVRVEYASDSPSQPLPRAAEAHAAPSATEAAILARAGLSAAAQAWQAGLPRHWRRGMEGVGGERGRRAPANSRQLAQIDDMGAC